MLIYRINLRRGRGKSGMVNTFQKSTPKPAPHFSHKQSGRSTPFDGDTFKLELLQTLQMYGFEWVKVSKRELGVSSFIFQSYNLIYDDD